MLLEKKSLLTSTMIARRKFWLAMCALVGKEREKRERKLKLREIFWSK